MLSDAGCDPAATLAALGNAVRRASIDFGVTIRFGIWTSRRSSTRPQPVSWIGEIAYPGSSEPGWLSYLR